MVHIKGIKVSPNSTCNATSTGFMIVSCTYPSNDLFPTNISSERMTFISPEEAKKIDFSSNISFSADVEHRRYGAVTITNIK